MEISIQDLDMFPALETELGSLYAIILPLIMVIVVVIIWSPKRMVRERYVKTTSFNSG